MVKTLLPFCCFWLKWWDIFWKRVVYRKRDWWFWNRGWGNSAYLYWGWRKFHAEPVCFFIFLVTKIAFKSSLDLSCMFISWLLIFFICLAMVQIQGKIHTKAFVDVSRGWRSWKVGNCFTMRSKWLAWG